MTDDTSGTHGRDMDATLTRRLKSLGWALLTGCVAAYGVLAGIEQLSGLATSRSIQTGPVVTGRTLSTLYTGAHGGARLRVQITTADGRRIIEHVWDGDSDGVHVRRTLPVAYLPSSPFQAEVAGQPQHTAGQAVLDVLVTLPFAAGAVACLLAACGVEPFDGLAQRARTRRPRAGVGGPRRAGRGGRVRARRGSRRGAWR